MQPTGRGRGRGMKSGVRSGTNVQDRGGHGGASSFDMGIAGSQVGISGMGVPLNTQGARTQNNSFHGTQAQSLPDDVEGRYYISGGSDFMSLLNRPILDQTGRNGQGSASARGAGRGAPGVARGRGGARPPM
jgi:hypothetical protein